MEKLLKNPFFWQLITLFPGSGHISIEDKNFIQKHSIFNFPSLNFTEKIPKFFLEEIKKKEFNCGVYIHYPFCRRICKFCMFGGIYHKNNKELIKFNNMFGKLCKKELEIWIKGLYKLYKKKGGPLSIQLLRIIHPHLNKDDFFRLLEPKLIHIGGGTPNLLSVKGFVNLFKNFREMYGNKFFEKVYWEVELSPEEEGIEEIINLLQENGCKRISLGVQTFNNKVRKFLGRGGDSELIWGLLEDLKSKFRIPLVNIDLLYGLPYLPISDSLKDVFSLINFFKDSKDVRFSIDIGRYIVTPRNYRLGKFELLDNHAGIWETFYFLNTVIRFSQEAKIFIRNGDFDYKLRVFSSPTSESNSSTPFSYEYYYYMPSIYGILIGIGPFAKSLFSPYLTSPIWYNRWDWKGWHSFLQKENSLENFLFSTYYPFPKNPFLRNLLLFHSLLIRFLYYKGEIPEFILESLPSKEKSFVKRIVKFLYKNKFFEKKDNSYKLPLGYNFLIPLISLLFIPYSYLKGKELLPGFMEIDIKGITEFSVGNKIIKESFQVKEAIAYALQKEILKR